MRLIADNSRWYRKATVTLSTVRLPYLYRMEQMYESCIFLESGSEVLAQYSTADEAVKGHHALASERGLK